MNPGQAHLWISALPTRGKLRLLKSLGIDVLVNCSGSQSEDIYGEQLLQGLEVHDFRFPDVFTHAHCADTALDTLGEKGLDQLSAAAEAVAEAFSRGLNVLVFCHLGVGRSPLVAAMALERAGLCDGEAALDRVRSIRPEADFSPVSLAVWSALRARWPTLERLDASL